MNVTFLSESYDCTKAVRRGSSAILHLTDGGTVEFSGVSDFAAFTLEGGSWSLPEVTAEEQMRADIDFLAAMTGVMLA